MLKKSRMSCIRMRQAITQLTAVACMFLSILERLYAKYKLYLGKLTWYMQVNAISEMQTV